MKGTLIAIPSYKRSDHLLTTKKNNILRYIKGSQAARNTCVQVRKEEYEKYIDVSATYGVKIRGIIIDPNTVHGIRDTRQEILEYAFQEEYEHLIMIDDDLKLTVRSANKYFDMCPEMFDTMIDDLTDYCTPTFPLTGITARGFSSEKEDKEYNTRIIQVFCMHLPTIKKSGITFVHPEYDMQEDYYFVISLLQAGYKNLVLTLYTRDDVPQYPGGCKEERKAEIYSERSKNLKRVFPDLVRLEWKTSAAWSDRRITPYINWKKAYVPTE